MYYARSAPEAGVSVGILRNFQTLAEMLCEVEGGETARGGVSRSLER
jgi:hypothetical protein